MKKILALMLALLIILSAPIVVTAKGDNLDNATGDTEVVSAKKIGKTFDVSEKRALVKEKLQARTMEAKQLRNRLLECKGDTSGDCKTLRKEAKKTAKNMLVKAADRVVKFLEKAKARIQKSKLSEDEKQAILAEIESEISEVETAKENVEAQTEITNKKQLKETVGKIKSIWKRVKSNIALKLHKTHLQRFGNVFKKTGLLDKKLKRMLNNLERKGVDISNVEITSFNSKLSEAKTAFEEANKFFADAKNEAGEKRKGLLAQAREKMKESHRLLKDAKEALKEILKKLRETRAKAKEQGIDLEESEEETETEDEEETETEDKQEETEVEEQEDQETEDLKTEENQSGTEE